MMKPLTNEQFAKVAQPFIELGRNHPATVALIAMVESQMLSSVNESIGVAGQDHATLSYRSGFQSHCSELLDSIEVLYQAREKRVEGVERESE